MDFNITDPLKIYSEVSVRQLRAWLKMWKEKEAFHAKHSASISQQIKDIEDELRRRGRKVT